MTDPRKQNWHKVRRTLVCWAALAPLLLVILFPFAVMLFTALKPQAEVMHFPVRWLPQQFAWQNFAAMWRATGFGTALQNSLVLSGISTVLAIVISVPAAYALARFRFAGKSSYRRFLLVTQMLSPILLVTGLFKMAAAIPFGDGNLIDTHTGVIITYTALNIAFSVWMLQSYFNTIPRDIEEAAWLEGCSRWRAVLSVFLPLVGPALAVTALFAFVNGWNEFAVAYTLIRSAGNQPLTVQIVDLVAGRYEVAWHMVMAAALLATLPVALLFAWLQKYFVQGLSMGSVK